MEIDAWSVSIAISHESSALFKSGLEKLSGNLAMNERPQTKISE